jgi:hypothetical protein
MRIRPYLVLAATAAAAYAPVGAMAQMSCAALGTFLAGQPYVQQVNATTPLTTLTTTGSPRCEANFAYSARGDVVAGYAAGQQQRIVLRVGLPLNVTDGGPASNGPLGAWNGKVQNLGGGGLAGSVGSVTAATDTGYVGSSTDSGHTSAENPNFAVIQATHTLNYGKLDDFLVESLHQQYRWALDLARTYFGAPATRNYWNGCSTGGRQGLSLALNYGADFDGFLVGAPANYNTRLQQTTLWPWWVNKDITAGSLTSAKFAAANASAIAACDAADGVIDGVLSDPRACTYDARNNVCGAPGAPATNCLSTSEAKAVNTIWDGPRNDQGVRIWFPFERGAAPSVSSTTTCGSNGNECWTHADTTFDWHPLPLSQFDDEIELSTRLVAPYSDIISTALEAAKNRGAKILMYHGGADPLIPSRQSIHYYNDALDRFGGVDQLKTWFRFFVAPGMGHCSGGVGPQPQSLFQRMVDWVETGVAPDSILATNTTAGVVTRSRPLCPWPQTAIYNGTGDPNSASSFTCGGNVDTRTTSCLDIVAQYQNETSSILQPTGRRNPATCNLSPPSF